MISLAPSRARVAALLTATLATTTVAVTAPAARAEATDPVLTAISLASSASVQPGDLLRVAYSATDDGQILRSLRIKYRDSAGRVSTWVLGSDLPLAGEVVWTVPQGLPNENLQVSEVELIDLDGNTVGFDRWGHICHSSSCGPEGHTLDLSVLDVRLDGSTPDNAVPEVTAIAAGTPSVAIGGTVRLVLTLNEPNPHPAQTWFQAAVLRHDSGEKVYLNDWDGEGTLSGTVPDTALNGKYVLQSLRIMDALGNLAVYGSSGRVSKSPTTSTGPTSHTLDFASTTVTVTGQTVDRASPVLTSIGYPRGLLQYGATNRIAFTGSDDLSGIDTIDLEYSSPTHYPGQFRLATTVTGTNTASGVMPMVNPGVWQLTQITVRDKAGHYSVYTAGGAIDLSALSVKVLGAPHPPYWTTTTRSGAVGLRWNPPGNDGGSPMLGYTVTVSPGGKSYSLGVTTRAFTVTGLSDNTKYSIAVRARNAVGLSTPEPKTVTPRALQRLFISEDLDYDGKPDLVGVTRSNTAFIYRGNGSGGISGSGSKAASGLAYIRALLPGGAPRNEQFFGGNVLAVQFDGTGDAWLGYNGNRLEIRQSLGLSGLGDARHVITPGNFIGTSRADVLTVTDAGDMYLWPARSDRDLNFYSPRKIGSGWQYFTTVIGVGDLDGDRRNDLVARKKDGTLWLYAGNGTGGFRYKKQIGTSTSWKSFAQLAGMGDFTGDKRNDLLALAPNGYLYVYKGNGKGGFSGKALVSKGFASFV